MFSPCFVMQCLVFFLSFAISLSWIRGPVALLQLFSFCHIAVLVLYLFFVVPWVGLRSMIVAFPGHIHLLQLELTPMMSFRGSEAVNFIRNTDIPACQFQTCGPEFLWPSGPCI